MHFVIMGCGRVGSTLAHSLEDRGHSVAVIDQVPEAFRRLGPSFTGRRVLGTGFDRDTLLEADIRNADAFAAVSNGDNSNVLAARVARETFGVQDVVARIYDPGRAEVYTRLGIPTVATVRWTADQMLRRLLPAGAATEWRDGSGSITLAEVHASLAWIGSRLRRIEEATRSRVAFLTRFGEGMLPDEHTVLQDGDLLHLLMRDTDVARVEAVLAAAPGGESERSGGKIVRVAIAGAGKVGRSIARELLAEGHAVLLIDRDPRAIRTTSVPTGEWLLADACELASLEEADLATCQVMIAATGDDKTNLVVSLLARTEFAVPRTVARVNDPRNEWMFDEMWGVDVAVSMPRLMTALVEEAVSVGDLVQLFSFRKSGTQLVELTLPEDCPFLGRPVADVPWPRAAVLVAIVRDNRPLAPSPDDPLEAADELLFLATEEAAAGLEPLLSPSQHGRSA